ncbi:hypothetical protein DB347_14085 [Opitutaceae bacterium EW11]|nr:hypothetical protein DB347_14085 [Opitutaceae bacterium EW11]
MEWRPASRERWRPDPAAGCADGRTTVPENLLPACRGPADLLGSRPPMKRCALLLLLALCFSGCAYVGTWAKQRYYARQLRHSPRQKTSKHLLDRSTFFVFGQVLGAPSGSGPRMAVVALSSTATPGEVVDVSPSIRGESYYGLNLPPGDYTLAAVLDRNRDGIYSESEVIAVRPLQLEAAAEEKIRGGIDIQVSSDSRGGVATAFRVPVRDEPPLEQSLFYPKGTLRRLDDPIFSPAMASLGMYEPAAFMEAAPMMFYALEEDSGYKVPVIFVHGIGGSARDFDDIVAALDRRRYTPWFFHYPSGSDLGQLGAMFYEIYLSGATIPKADNPLVIVAHSMGGLVVREALNRRRGTDREPQIATLITIASPLGGHPAAARGVHAPVVIPSWRNLDPKSRFIESLHRKPLPAGMPYHLFFARGEHHLIEVGEQSDGVVPVANQLPAEATHEASELLGFDCSHTGVLHDPSAISRIVGTIETVKSVYPPDHLKVLDRGGYARELPPEDFSPIDRYGLRQFGGYIDALVSGQLQPINAIQRQFVDECTGRQPVTFPLAKAWLKYQRLYASDLPVSAAK